MGNGFYNRIKGQPVALNMLKNDIERGCIPNTMLFYGPDGCGKFLTSIEVARVLNCEEEGKESCNCQSCMRSNKLVSTDLFIICKSNLRNSFDLWKRFGVNEKNVRYLMYDLRRLALSISSDERHYSEISELEEFFGDTIAIINHFDDLIDLVYKILNHLEARIITIDMIRNAQRVLSLKSGSGKYRILIIDGAESMNEEAQNSFLKISEDTPPGALIILTAVSKELLRSTIISRCRLYRFIGLNDEVQKEIIKEKFQPVISDDTHTSLSGMVYDHAFMNRYYEKIASGENNLEIMNEVADRIDSEGHTAGFFEYILDRLRNKKGELLRWKINEIYDYEELIKKTSKARSTVLYSNANPEIVLMDFLLHNMKDVIKYC